MLRGAALFLTRNRFRLRGLVLLVVLAAPDGKIFGAESNDAPEQFTDSLIKLHGQHARAADWEKTFLAA